MRETPTTGSAPPEAVATTLAESEFQGIAEEVDGFLAAELRSRCEGECEYVSSFQAFHETWGTVSVATWVGSSCPTGGILVHTDDDQVVWEWRSATDCLSELKPSGSLTPPSPEGSKPPPRPFDQNHIWYFDYNIGRDNGVIALVPRHDGFDDQSSLPTDGGRRFYNAHTADLDGDGTYEIIDYDENKVALSVSRWDGVDFAVSPLGSTDESVEQMRSALETAGFECDYWQLRPVTPTSKFSQAASCTYESSLGIFSSREVIDSIINQEGAVGQRAFVTNGSWLVQCGWDVDTCREIQAILGGELVVRGEPDEAFVNIGRCSEVDTDRVGSLLGIDVQRVGVAQLVPDDTKVACLLDLDEPYPFSSVRVLVAEEYIDDFGATSGGLAEAREALLRRGAMTSVPRPDLILAKYPCAESAECTVEVGVAEAGEQILTVVLVTLEGVGLDVVEALVDYIGEALLLSG